MKDLVTSFRELVGGVSSEATEADLLLLQVDDETARRLRLCAIPHTFDPTILAILDPSVTPELAEDILREFDTLPAVIQLPGCRALHDIVRGQLFAQWL